MITLLHTPGPWSSDGRFITAPDPTGTRAEIYIAEIIDTDDEARLATPEQQSANADLIGAAPNLLDAAAEVVARWDNGDLAAAVRALAAVITGIQGDMP